MHKSISYLYRASLGICNSRASCICVVQSKDCWIDRQSFKAEHHHNDVLVLLYYNMNDRYTAVALQQQCNTEETVTPMTNYLQILMVGYNPSQLHPIRHRNEMSPLRVWLQLINLHLLLTIALMLSVFRNFAPYCFITVRVISVLS